VRVAATTLAWLLGQVVVALQMCRRCVGQRSAVRSAAIFVVTIRVHVGVKAGFTRVKA
jgi:hypothetical protein